MNGDGLLNSLDVDAFVAYLTGGQGATGMRAAYAWDAENRLTSVTPTAPQAGDKKLVFAYDYLGRRIEKQVFDWDDQAADWQATPSVQRKFVWGGTVAGGWLLLMELDGSDNVVRKYTWGLDLAGQHGSVNSLESAGGIGGLLAVAQAQVGGGSAAGGIDAGEYVFAYDANGNVAQVLDLSAASAAAAIVAHYEYDPYGGVVNNLSGYTYAEANPIRFSTKYHDAETGLGYWGYRYYSARLGRWLSRDPIEERGGTHLCAYVLNSPTSATDPLGQMCFCSTPCPLPPPPIKGDCSSCWSTCTSAAGQAMGRSGALGYVICRPDGCRCPCAVLRKLPRNPRARSIVQTCILQHEECHMRDRPDFVQCPPDKCGPMLVGPRGRRGPSNAAAECPCYGSELQCLAAGRGNCQGDSACQTVVEDRIRVVIRSICRRRNCPVSNYTASLPQDVRQLVKAICPEGLR